MHEYDDDFGVLKVLYVGATRLPKRRESNRMIAIDMKYEIGFYGFLCVVL